MAKPRLLIDSDIIIDLVAKREHYPSAAELFTLLDDRTVEGCTTPIVLANVEYVLRKYGGKVEAKKAIQTLLATVTVLTMNQTMARAAADSSFPDFEDAMQYYAAEQGKVNFIITRNKTDYSRGTITVLTAEEFLDMHSAIAEAP